MPGGAGVVSESEVAVLDASALLAYLQGEVGSTTVGEALARGAVMSTVNYAETLSRLSDTGESPDTVNETLSQQGLIGGLLELVPLTEEDAVSIARLRHLTRAHGLSLGDRACLATALRLRRPVITADRTWDSLSVGVTIQQVRP
jgi:ribonuclease VapC